MNLTAGQIADQINGTIIGNRDVDIFNISKIEEGTKGSLTFLANPKYTEFIYSTNASAAIVGNDFEATRKINTTLIKVKDPTNGSFATLKAKAENGSLSSNFISNLSSELIFVASMEPISFGLGR